MKNPKLLKHTVISVALMLISAAASGNTPNPTTVTIVGTFQSALGCGGDWQADCITTHLTYRATDDVWQGMFVIPAGSWEYKVALDDSWDENYGLYAAPGGASIPLALSEDAYVRFYYDHKTHWVTDDYNSIIATVPGNYLFAIGGMDWQPNCMRSWLQDPDGDGMYTFSTDLIPAGSYEARVAYYGNWGNNFGVGGDPYGPNYQFAVPAPGTLVEFVYDPVTHVLVISTGGAENLPPIAVAGDDQSVRAGETVNLDGSGSHDDNTPSPLLLYSWNFASLPAGSTAVLSGADTPTPGFLADRAGAYVVALTVTDEAGSISAPDEVVVSTENQAPTAVAAVDPVLIILGNVVYLDGSGSTDPDGDPLAYAWTLVNAPAGSAAELVGADGPMATLTPDVEGVYKACLVVSDPLGPGTPACVTIRATTPADYAESNIVDAVSKMATLKPSQVSTPGNRTALGNFLKQAEAALEAGDAAAAINKLNNAIERADGCALRGKPDGNGPGRDWVTDCAAQAEIYPLLVEALEALIN